MYEGSHREPVHRMWVEPEVVHGEGGGETRGVEDLVHGQM